LKSAVCHTTRMPNQTKTLRVNLWRGDARGGEFVAYRVPRAPSQTVLDVVTWVQRNAAPDLSYRFACRVGMCGTCAMTVNGKPRWTCRAHVKDVARGDHRGRQNRDAKPHIDIAPLRNLPVVKDLVCDMTVFFDKWQRAGGRFNADANRDRHAPVAPIPAGDATRAHADAAVECINCAVCYAACDVVAWNPDYLGPAALNRAWSLINDARESTQTQRERLATVTAAGGCQHCHSQQSCARHCPVQLSPARAIAGLKKRAFQAALGGRL